MGQPPWPNSPQLHSQMSRTSRKIEEIYPQKPKDTIIQRSHVEVQTKVRVPLDSKYVYKLVHMLHMTYKYIYIVLSSVFGFSFIGPLLPFLQPHESPAWSFSADLHRCCPGLVGSDVRAALLLRHGHATGRLGAEWGRPRKRRKGGWDMAHHHCVTKKGNSEGGTTVNTKKTTNSSRRCWSSLVAPSLVSNGRSLGS